MVPNSLPEREQKPPTTLPEPSKPISGRVPATLPEPHAPNAQPARSRQATSWVLWLVLGGIALLVLGAGILWWLGRSTPNTVAQIVPPTAAQVSIAPAQPTVTVQPTSQPAPTQAPALSQPNAISTATMDATATPSAVISISQVPLFTGENDDLRINVYTIQTFDVPADAPQGLQAQAGMQPIALDIEAINKKTGLLKTYLPSVTLTDANGTEYKFRASLVAAYELYACYCTIDQTQYEKIVDGNFLPNESARTIMVFEAPKGITGLDLNVPYALGAYADEGEAFLAKKGTLVVRGIK